MAYPIAPWIQGPGNLAQDWISGLQAGSSIAKEQAQLQQTAQLKQLQLSLDQQQQQRENLINQQKLQVEKAYHDQQTQLDMMRLQQEGQMNQVKMQEAMRKMALQQQYSQRITSGEDPSKVLLELGPQMGMEGSAISAAIKARTTPAVPKSVSPLGKLQADRAEAQRRGDTEAVKQFDAAIAESLTNKGFAASIAQDDQGRPVINFSQGGAQIPTVATQSLAQQRNLQYENAVELLSWLQKHLKPEHVGVAGKGGEFLVDRTLAQILPGVADKDRIDVRSTLDTAQGLARTLVDSPNDRFSQTERNAVLGALPSTGVFESYEDAQGKLARAKEVLQNRGRVYTGQLKQPIPFYALTPQELKERWKAAKTPDEKERIKDAFRRFYGLE